MGYLGVQERRADPMSGLIQMGARFYDPQLGAFLSEDVVYGAVGIGTSLDRYAYVWGNPVNLYDLDGRDVCVPTPFGDACAEEAAETAEDLGNVAGDVGNAAWNARKTAVDARNDAVDAAWDWTAPGRQQVADLVRCVSPGNLRNVGFTASRGAGASLPFGASVGVGPLFSNASRNTELADPAAYGGASARPTAGPTAGLNATYGRSKGKTVYTVSPWVGISAGPPVTSEAGVSWTGTQSWEW
jgi:RHS repeat-associated protein